MASSHGGKKMWCIPKLTDEFLERMYDVLTLYERSYDPKLPVVCLDEKCVELRGDIRKPLRKKGGLYRDHEYQRQGTANVFVMTEPKGGRHYGRVTKRRTNADFAQAMKFLAERYPDAVTIHLVMDNLSTHTERALIHRFGEKIGRRLWARFTVHYTPKHASWLNQAEIMIGALSRTALGGRIPDIDALRRRVTPFFRNRRRDAWTISWGFTCKNAKAWVRTFLDEH
jgi:transposase